MYTGDHANYYANYSAEGYADFGSGPQQPESQFQPAPAPPDPHGPPPPSSESFGGSSVDRATLAQFSPPGKSSMQSGSLAFSSSVHNAFAMQSNSLEGDVWIADSGASCHMTHDGVGLYDLRPPPPGHETVTIGERT